jgi:hypothetical protein
MLNDENKPILTRTGEAELPRWIQVLAGIIVALFALFGAFATVDMLLLAGIKRSPSPLLALAVVLALLLGCLWVLVKCFRLVTGRKKGGGPLSPKMLRVVAIFLLIIPVAGLFTGYYRAMGLIAIFQAVMYIFGFFGLWKLAWEREASRDENPKSEETETSRAR